MDTHDDPDPACLLRDALAALRRERRRSERLGEEVLAQGMMLVAISRAMIATHPDPGALREAWDREISCGWAAQATFQSPRSDIASRLQRVLEGAFGS